MTVGIDIVYLPEFAARVKDADTATKIFLSTELTGKDANSRLAGFFAAKEAFLKALGHKADWHEIWIEHDESGKPNIRSTLLRPNEHAELSISHAGDYAVAIVILYK